MAASTNKKSPMSKQIEPSSPPDELQTAPEASADEPTEDKPARPRRALLPIFNLLLLLALIAALGVGNLRVTRRLAERPVRVEPLERRLGFFAGFANLDDAAELTRLAQQTAEPQAIQGEMW